MGTSPGPGSPLFAGARRALTYDEVRAAEATGIEARPSPIPLPDPHPEHGHWGWRGLVRRATGGLLSPAATGAESAHRAREELVRTCPLPTAARVACLDADGTRRGGSGVDGAAAALVLAETIARLRQCPVAVAETTSRPGRLAHRAAGTHLLGRVDLTGDRRLLESAVAVQDCGSEVVAAGGPADDVLTPADQEALLECLTGYPLTLLSSPTLWTSSEDQDLHHALLPHLDALVVTAPATNAGRRRAEQLLTELATAPARPHLHALADRAVLIFSDPGRPGQLATTPGSTLAGRGVQLLVPADAHLASGGRVRTEQLTAASRVAWTRAAAELVLALASTPPPAERSPTLDAAAPPGGTP